MLRILIIILVTSFTESLKHCDPAYCSHEGQCFIENNTKNCRCIGDTYFQGTFCAEVVDNCLSNPCQNGGQCQSLVGQFMCRDCPEGYGSLWCDVQKENIFQNLALYFNHYAYAAVVQHFILVLEDLGSVDFSLELIADNYVIDSFETNPKVLQKQWIYSTDLTAIIRQHDIRYYNDLPFKKGYYRLAQETFWDLGILKITLRSYDTELATDLFHFQVYDLLLLKPEYLKCLPQIKFRHGSDPMDPRLLDISGFNNFEPVVMQRCAANSKFHFHWHIFNSVGNTMLYNFGNSTKPLLKVPPYRLWFNYHGEVMSSYSLVVTMVEKFNHSFETKTEARVSYTLLDNKLIQIVKSCEISVFHSSSPKTCTGCN